MKQLTRPWLLLIAGLLLFPSIAVACLWDYDTLKQERSRFPGTLELITGKFLRHSPEFYEWRIKDRLSKIELQSNLGSQTWLDLHDDLAVAYQKTGKTDKAIEVMLEKEKSKPGLYKTYSNLGTFYILAGQFEKGLPYIDKALAINPDAHFGREKYQKWLVEYAMTTKGLPMKEHGQANFRSYLALKLNKSAAHELNANDINNAINAILGMMRFADHDNPLLLEALGDLLGFEDNPYEDAKRLAARAYLAAAAKMKDEQSREKYRMHARYALSMQVVENDGGNDDRRLEIIESEFKLEMEDANRWYAELREREIAWIAAGVNVDEEFDKLYSAEPAVDSPSNDADRDADAKSKFRIPLISAAVLMLAVVIGAGVLYVMKFIA